MKQGLILVAHGSPRKEANREFFLLCSNLQKKLPGVLVRGAALGSSRPSITEALDQLKTEGASEIKILPYFLLSGKHTTRDIPEIVRLYQEQNPNLKLTLLSHLGDSASMIDFLVGTQAPQFALHHRAPVHPHKKS